MDPERGYESHFTTAWPFDKAAEFRIGSFATSACFEDVRFAPDSDREAGMTKSTLERFPIRLTIAGIGEECRALRARDLA